MHFLEVRRRRTVAAMSSVVNANAKMVANQEVNMVIPASIKAKFREDYDILSIHRIVTVKIKREMEHAQMMIKNGSSDEKYRQEADPSRLSIYLTIAEEYMRLYNEFPKKKEAIDIMDVGNYYYEPDDNDIGRIHLIEAYAEYVSEFIDIELVCTGRKGTSSSYMCDDCGTSLIGILPDSEGATECPECFNSKYISKPPTRRPTPDTVPTCNNYEDQTNFVKALNRYQGKILPKSNIEDVRNAIEDYLADAGMPSCDDYKQRPIGRAGMTQGTSVGMLLDIMLKSGLKCYSDVYYVGRECFGWKLADLSDIEDMLIDDYRITQDVWYRMPKVLKTRDSSLPVWYRVFQHLRRRGWDCAANDFKIPKNVPECNEMWRYMCQNCGDPDMKYIPV